MKNQYFPHQLTSFLIGILFLFFNSLILADEKEEKEEKGEIIETMPSWSTTEIHFQYGNLDTPGFAGGGDADTFITTLQHASSWKFIDNFFFIDFLHSSNSKFNDNDFYGEFYPTLSLSRLTSVDFSYGLISDIGIIAGVNAGADANVLKYLPGVRFSLDLPKFAFANLDVTAYIDDSRGFSSGGAPKEDDSFMIDFNWALPFSIKDHDFSIEGHVEYIGERENEFGSTVEWHILAQPQFRYDLGKILFQSPQKLFIGIEPQIWINKLGDKDTDEFAIQGLLVWRF